MFPWFPPILHTFSSLGHLPNAHVPIAGVREEDPALALVLCDLRRVPAARVPLLRHSERPDLRLQHPDGPVLVSDLRVVDLRMDSGVLAVLGTVRPDQVGGLGPPANGHDGLAACLHGALVGWIQAHDSAQYLSVAYAS